MRQPAHHAPRLTKIVAVIGLVVSAVAIAVAIGVDRVQRVQSYASTDSGGVAYSGVFTVWVEPAWRVPTVVISLVVIALATLVLTHRLPLYRRTAIGLMLAGDLYLMLWLGGLLFFYLELWGIGRGIPG